MRQPGAGSGVELSTSFDRDLFGNIVKVTARGPGLAARSKSYRYEDTGRFVVWSRNALGHETAREHQLVWGWLLKDTDANGLVSRREYNSLGVTTASVRPDGKAVSIVAQ